MKQPKITADSIVAKIAQLPTTLITLAVKNVQGDEKLCRMYLQELYEQKDHKIMYDVFGTELMNEIVTFVESKN